MPACPPELEGTWIDSSLRTYYRDGTVENVTRLLDIAAEFQAERQVPVFCGEFGVYRRNSDDANRVYWYQVVRSYLEEKGVPWTIWDYQGGFGLFESGTNELFEHDLNVGLVEALGLDVPEQTPFVLTPDTEGFALYTDYMEPNVSAAGWLSDGSLDYYWDIDPACGLHCIYCTGIDRYNAIAFDFKPDKDLSFLVQAEGALEFWVRGDTPGARFDVRFVDTKTADPDDHPWRMGTTIDGEDAAWDGQWHLVRIPLASLTERGSWDDAWFNARGAYDWSAVDRFEIVSEYHNFAGMQFWFDDIRITIPPGTR